MGFSNRRAEAYGIATPRGVLQRRLRCRALLSVWRLVADHATESHPGLTMTSLPLVSILRPAICRSLRIQILVYHCSRIQSQQARRAPVSHAREFCGSVRHRSCAVQRKTIAQRTAHFPPVHRCLFITARMTRTEISHPLDCFVVFYLRTSGTEWTVDEEVV